MCLRRSICVVLAVFASCSNCLSVSNNEINNAYVENSTCKSNVIDLDIVTNTLKVLFEKRMDIIEIHFDIGNVSLNISSVDGEDKFDINDPRNLYGLLIYFLVTDKGKAILKYPADADSILSLYTLGSRKTIMNVPISFDSVDCLFNFTSLKENIRNNVALIILASDTSFSDLYICNFEVHYQMQSSIFWNSFIPYYTYNDFDTTCFQGNITEDVQQSVTCKVIFVISCFIVYTFPLVLAVLPNTPETNTAEYKQDDIPYSFNMLWSTYMYVYYGKHNEKNIANGCKNVISFINPLCRNILLVTWISVSFNLIIHEYIKKQDNTLQYQFINTTQSSAVGSNLTDFFTLVGFQSLMVLTLCVCEEQIKRWAEALSQSDLDNERDEHIQPEQNCHHKQSNMCHIHVFNISKIFRTCTCMKKKDVFEDFGCDCFEVNTPFHFQYIKRIDNSILSWRCWWKVVKLSCLLESDYSIATKIVLIPFYVVVFVVNVALVILFNVPIFNGYLAYYSRVKSSCHVLRHGHTCTFFDSRVKSSGHVLRHSHTFFWKIILSYLLEMFVIVPFYLVVVLVSFIVTCIRSIQFIIQFLILTVFVGLPFYPSTSLSRITLILALIKLLIQAWSEFQEEIKLFLKAIFEEIDPKPLTIPKDTFDIVYKNAVNANITMCITKCAVIVTLFYISNQALSESGEEPHEWGSIISAAMLFFSPEALGILYGKTGNDKENLIKKEVADVYKRTIIKKEVADVNKQMIKDNENNGETCPLLSRSRNQTIQHNSNANNHDNGDITPTPS